MNWEPPRRILVFQLGIRCTSSLLFLDYQGDVIALWRAGARGRTCGDDNACEDLSNTTEMGSTNGAMSFPEHAWDGNVTCEVRSMHNSEAPTPSSEIAMLAPVNSEHLFSGLKVLGAEVAFGSDAKQTLDSLERTLAAYTVEVHIYASHPERTPDKYYEYWRAKLLRIHSGTESEIAGLRPASCKGDTPFERYWIVTDLHPVIGNGLPITKMCPCGPLNAKPYKESFRPKGPLLINYPGQLPGD